MPFASSCPSTCVNTALWFWASSSGSCSSFDLSFVFPPFFLQNSVSLSSSDDNDEFDFDDEDDEDDDGEDELADDDDGDSDAAADDEDDDASEARLWLAIAIFDQL